MPTVHKTLTDTTEVDLIVPPKHRKVRVRYVKFVNTGSSAVNVSLKQVSPDGSLSKDVDTIVLQSGQSEMADGCWGVYDLDRGFKLVGSLSASGTVLVTVTYELI